MPTVLNWFFEIKNQNYNVLRMEDVESEFGGSVSPRADGRLESVSNLNDTEN